MYCVESQAPMTHECVYVCAHTYNPSLDLRKLCIRSPRNRAKKIETWANRNVTNADTNNRKLEWNSLAHTQTHVNQLNDR